MQIILQQYHLCSIIHQSIVTKLQIPSLLNSGQILQGRSQQNEKIWIHLPTSQPLK